MFATSHKRTIAGSNSKEVNDGFDWELHTFYPPFTSGTGHAEVTGNDQSEHSKNVFLQC